QADGKLVATTCNASGLSGFGSGFNDLTAIVTGNLLERFLPDSTFDPGYRVDPQVTSDMVQRNPSTGQITAISNTARLLATYPDGRVLLGYLATNSTYRLVRLTSSGTLDSTFH